MLRGAFAFLAHTIHRGLDGLRTRGITVTSTSCYGESLVKTEDDWTPWAIPLLGFSGKSWIPEWIAVMGECCLPGPDCLVNGVNNTGTAWLPRPATTTDLETVFRIVLQLAPIALSPEAAAALCVHGLRSYYVTALTQLRARRADRERAGAKTRSKGPYQHRQNPYSQKLFGEQTRSPFSGYDIPTIYWA